MSDADLWREAAEKEIKSLQDLNVYKLVPRSTVPPGQTVIGTKWIFKVKIKRTRRAWLHKAGTRYLDKTAAALSLQSADRRVCGWCSRSPQDWEVRQLRVKTAFLYADIAEEMFAAEPPGFETNYNK